jgi:pimeloyl-ACP methyl ester carboxylesterase
MRVRAVDLPSTSPNPPPDTNLSTDAAAVREVIEQLGDEVVVCGHSYGGMVISHPAVGTHPQVARLVYLCAFMPDSGQSLLSLRGGQNAPWIRTDERGMTLPDPEQALAAFYGDCDPATQQWALGQLRPQPEACYLEPVTTAAWTSTPSTYIVCRQDGAIPLELQLGLLAPKAQEILELNASHSPFLSQPAALAELLAGGR